MRRTEKVRYEVDPHNRLVVTRRGRLVNIPDFRTVIDGRFVIDEGNSLTYHVKKPRGSDIPQQIKLSGSWSLDGSHDLVFTLDKWNEGCFGNELTLKGGIIDVRGDRLSFAVATRDSSGGTSIYVLNLEGVWQADKYNRLTFNVIRENGAPDSLTFRGAWEINKSNEIIYTYTKVNLKRRTKVEEAVMFRGYWDLTSRNRLIYVLNKEIGSQFDFRVSVGEPAARGLKYELGIGAAPSKKRMTLFGSWRVDERLGLLFEMPCEGGKARGVTFGADIKLGLGPELDVKLKDEFGKDLGIKLKLSKNILKGAGEAFVEALASREEFSVSAGAGFRW